MDESAISGEATGREGLETNPRTWSSFDIAVAAEHRADGIGFMLLNSGIGAFDVDDCRTPDTGVLHEWAIALDQRAGTYAEATVSGTGIRIIGLAPATRCTASRW